MHTGGKNLVVTANTFEGNGQGGGWLRAQGVSPVALPLVCSDAPECDSFSGAGEAISLAETPFPIPKAAEDRLGGGAD